MYLKIFVIFIKTIFGCCCIYIQTVETAFTKWRVVTYLWRAAARLHVEVDMWGAVMLRDDIKSYPRIYIYVIG